MTDTTATNTVLTEVTSAITTLETILPTIINIVALFVPGAKAVIPFLPLLGEALNAVQIVAQATGGNLAAAITDVEKHLTPGQPNAPALAPNPADAPINTH